MKTTNMTLSEAQLADLFKNESIKHTSTSDAIDCLESSPASSTRLKHIENIANDHTAAQAFKASFALKEWSEVVSDSIEKSQHSWFKFLGMSSPMKTAFATASFAIAFAFALPLVTQFNNQQPTFTVTSVEQSVVQNDVIKSIPFDGPTDRLSRGGFDGKNQNTTSDKLFDASFG